MVKGENYRKTDIEKNRTRLMLVSSVNTEGVVKRSDGEIRGRLKKKNGEGGKLGKLKESHKRAENGVSRP